jgi:hypothetical protein
MQTLGWLRNAVKWWCSLALVITDY